MVFWVLLNLSPIFIFVTFVWWFFYAVSLYRRGRNATIGNNQTNALFKLSLLVIVAHGPMFASMYEPISLLLLAIVNIPTFLLLLVIKTLPVTPLFVRWVVRVLFLVLIAFIFILFYDDLKKEALVNYAIMFNQPQLCDQIENYFNIQHCVYGALDVDSAEEVNDCQYFRYMTNSYVECINAKTLRENDLSICNALKQDRDYEKLNYEFEECVSNYVEANE